MGERKVLNKYYPADFDPARLPRRPKNSEIKVRMMLPMSIRCGTCGNYIYKGTKFNSRKEDVTGETYLGVQIFRFYFRCTNCSAEIIIKTDPQNSDYVVESGASRNFEPWRAEDNVEADREKRKRDAEEMGDAMKSLENRASGLKREMDDIAALDELKILKTRQAAVCSSSMLEALRRMNDDGDDLDLGTLRGDLKRQKSNKKPTDCSTRFRLPDGGSGNLAGASRASKGRNLQCNSSFLILKKVEVTIISNSSQKSKQDTAVFSGSGLQSLCQQYGCDENDD